MNLFIFASDAEELAHLESLLSASGHSMRLTSTLPELLGHLGEHPCDVLLASVAALGANPQSALAPARALLAPGTPILVIAEAANEDQLLAALEAGAADYVLKPLRRAELAARLRILMRRARRDHPELGREEFDGYSFDSTRLCASFDKKSVVLTRKEFELALLLFRHLGRPLSRVYLLETLWPNESDQISRSLDTHISRVRSKLGLRPENGFRLNPVYSYGYVLERLAPATDGNVMKD